MNAWRTKPPPNASKAKSPERPHTIRRDRRKGAARLSVLCPTSTRGESRVKQERPLGGRQGREEAAEKRRSPGGQGPKRAANRRDGVVDTKDTVSTLRRSGLRDYGLLEGHEWPALQSRGRNGSAKRCQQQHPEGVRQGEDSSRSRH